MVKKYQLLLFVSIITTLVVSMSWIVSCTKQNDQNYPNLNLGLKQGPWINPANEDNEFDSVGILHNMYMDSIMNAVVNAYMDSTIGNWDLGQVITIANNILERNGYDTTDNREIATMVSLSISDRYSNAISSLNLSTEAQIIFENLFDSIYILADAGIENNVYYFATIKRYEDQIIHNLSLDTIDKVILLCGTSVWRHSIAFWTELPYGYDPNQEDDTTNIQMLPPILKKVIVATADVLGGVAGAGAGAVSGTAAGALIGEPVVGMVVGATAGAVTGATSASNGTATMIERIEKEHNGNHPDPIVDSTNLSYS